MNLRNGGRWRAVVLGLVLGAGLLAAAFAPAVASAEEPPGEIRFRTKNSIVTAKGIFHSWRFSEIKAGGGSLGIESAVVTVDLASVDTGIARRDKHLRTADFFDVEQFPTATGRIYDIAPGRSPEDPYTAKLDLDLHGKQKTISFAFELVTADPLEVRGGFEIDRRDFEIGKPKSLNPMSIKNEVAVSFSGRMPPSSEQ